MNTLMMTVKSVVSNNCYNDDDVLSLLMTMINKLDEH